VFGIINTGAIIPSFLRGPGNPEPAKIHGEKEKDEPPEAFN